MAEPPTLTKLTVDELLPMAEEGNAAAQLELGYRYYTGMDPAVTKDLPRSTSYFEQAASAGHPDAQFELGVRFEKGWGVDKDPARALEWFVRSSEQGHKKATKAVTRFCSAAQKRDERHEEKQKCKEVRENPLGACEAAMQVVNDVAAGLEFSLQEAERKQTSKSVCILCVATKEEFCVTIVSRVNIDKGETCSYSKKGVHTLADWNKAWVYPLEVTTEAVSELLDTKFYS